MYHVSIKCVCPKIHRFDSMIKKRKYAIVSVESELTNKTLVGSKLHIFCPECKEITVVLIEDVLAITQHTAGPKKKSIERENLDFLNLDS